MWECACPSFCNMWLALLDSSPGSCYAIAWDTSCTQDLRHKRNLGYSRVGYVTSLPLSTSSASAHVGLYCLVRLHDLTNSEPKIGGLTMPVTECRYCNNCGGKWIQVTVLRKRTFIFKSCRHCQKGSGRKTGQLTLLDQPVFRQK